MLLERLKLYFKQKFSLAKISKSYVSGASTSTHKRAKSDKQGTATFYSEPDTSLSSGTSDRLPQFEELEGWEIVGVLGEGNFSTVYQGREKTSGFEAAIKVISRKNLKLNQLQNVYNEVAILQRASHDNIIRMLHFKETEKYYFIMLELMKGGELFHRIVHLTYFSEPLARHVILQVAKAVQYLHDELGVVHRDIKSENLLFEPISIIPRNGELAESGSTDEGEFIANRGGGGIGRVKLADFGLSKIIWNKDTNTPCGTMGYTAPEVLTLKRYSKGVDIWGIGCVLYTLLCGFPPFFDDDSKLVTKKVTKGDFEFMSPWWDNVSEEAKDLISHLLVVDPRKRYTLEEFFAHPWCQIPAQPLPSISNKGSNNQTLQSLPEEEELHFLDSPWTSENDLPQPIPIPIALSKLPRTISPSMMDDAKTMLKTALNVSYAINRQTEEAFLREQRENILINSPHLKDEILMGDFFGEKRTIFQDNPGPQLAWKLASGCLSENRTSSDNGFPLTLETSTLLSRRCKHSVSDAFRSS